MGLKPNVNPKVKKIFWKNLNSLVIKLELIYQTRERVFPPISKHREAGWKNEAQPSFLTNFEETLFRVFKIASQTIDNSWSKSLQNFMIIKITFPNLFHGSDLLRFGLMNY